MKGIKIIKKEANKLRKILINEKQLCTEYKVRSDDNIETANARYDTYLNQTLPLINYYQEKGILREIKVRELDTIDDVFNKIKSLINYVSRIR